MNEWLKEYKEYKEMLPEEKKIIKLSNSIIVIFAL